MATAMGNPPEYAAMIRRGWPNDGAVDRVEVIGTGATLSNGDWVTKNPDGSVSKAPAAAATNDPVGLVVSGNGDAASAANTNKAVVLWSGFTADLSAASFDTAPTYVPGSPLMAANGKLTLQTGVYPIVARVLEVTSASTTDVAHITVLVK